MKKPKFLPPREEGQKEVDQFNANFEIGEDVFCYKKLQLNKQKQPISAFSMPIKTKTRGPAHLIENVACVFLEDHSAGIVPCSHVFKCNTFKMPQGGDMHDHRSNSTENLTEKSIMEYVLKILEEKEAYIINIKKSLLYVNELETQREMIVREIHRLEQDIVHNCTSNEYFYQKFVPKIQKLYSDFIEYELKRTEEKENCKNLQEEFLEFQRKYLTILFGENNPIVNTFFEVSKKN